jgi:lipoprotein NlpI
MKQTLILCAVAALTLASACSPKVQIVPSKEPIRIDLNVNINQEIRVRLDKDVEDLIANNPDLF